MAETRDCPIPTFGRVFELEDKPEEENKYRKFKIATISSGMIRHKGELLNFSDELLEMECHKLDKVPVHFTGHDHPDKVGEYSGYDRVGFVQDPVFNPETHEVEATFVLENDNPASDKVASMIETGLDHGINDYVQFSGVAPSKLQQKEHTSPTGRSYPYLDVTSFDEFNSLDIVRKGATSTRVISKLSASDNKSVDDFIVNHVNEDNTLESVVLKLTEDVMAVDPKEATIKVTTESEEKEDVLSLSGSELDDKIASAVNKAIEPAIESTLEKFTKRQSEALAEEEQKKNATLELSEKFEDKIKDFDDAQKDKIRKIVSLEEDSWERIESTVKAFYDDNVTKSTQEISDTTSQPAVTYDADQQKRDLFLAATKVDDNGEELNLNVYYDNYRQLKPGNMPQGQVTMDNGRKVDILSLGKLHEMHVGAPPSDEYLISALEHGYSQQHTFGTEQAKHHLERYLQLSGTTAVTTADFILGTISRSNLRYENLYLSLLAQIGINAICPPGTQQVSVPRLKENWVTFGGMPVTYPDVPGEVTDRAQTDIPDAISVKLDIDKKGYFYSLSEDSIDSMTPDGILDSVERSIARAGQLTVMKMLMDELNGHPAANTKITTATETKSYQVVSRTTPTAFYNKTPSGGIVKNYDGINATSSENNTAEKVLSHDNVWRAMQVMFLQKEFHSIGGGGSVAQGTIIPEILVVPGGYQAIAESLIATTLKPVDTASTALSNVKSLKTVVPAIISTWNWTDGTSGNQNYRFDFCVIAQQGPGRSTTAVIGYKGSLAPQVEYDPSGAIMFEHDRFQIKTTLRAGVSSVDPRSRVLWTSQFL